jgi:hypothetical protein
MAIATDNTAEVERTPALLDRPQPLGFLPTRQFWRDPENARLAGPPVALALPILSILAILLSPTWWIAGLAAAASVVLMQGLLERYIRHAARRRFRLPRAKLAQHSNPPDRAPFE